MRQFADLHLHSKMNLENVEEIIRKASELDYKLVGLSLHEKTRRNQISYIEKTCRDYGLDFAARIDLIPKSSKGLLEALRRNRRKFELVAINCLSKSVARQAAKDHRVDLLCFPSPNPRKRFFDNAEARLASQAVAALEINMALVLGTSGFSRIRLLSSLKRETEIAKRRRIPIIVSSGATDTLQMRGPQEFASLCTLFGFDDESALNSLSINPSAIVARNRAKLDPKYVAEGIRIVRRERN